ncbi:MaoC family dehydratase [Halobacterium noricense]|uniref:MaoC family dehydratase n=1 Tax=Halobacterium noricense TaxID=223182 RepID=UPI001E4E4DFB|nr:MaoC family dehydratase [Halobacterium noricense]UHH23970.1 MaoC family dehydratase [Halobacterium noricense]
MVRYFEDIEVGESYDLGSYVAEKEEVLSFARRYDPQPIHTNPEVARETIFGGLIASGWHTASSCMALMVDGFLSETATLGSFGLDELRWRNPVYPGDTIDVEVEILETTASESHDDRGYVQNAVRGENDDSEEVIYWRATNILVTDVAANEWPVHEM